MSVFICGTDTGIGKTITSAALLGRYPRAVYWKPVQTGTPPDDDRRTVLELSGADESRCLPTTFRYREPLSPHRAAELEGARIELEDLTAAYREHASRSLIVEGAGGLLVPLNRTHTWLDFLTATELPLVLVARNSLGTINHTLLTVRVLRNAGVPIAGLIFCGRAHPAADDNVRTIADFSGVPVIGRFAWSDGDALPADLDAGGILEALL